MRTIEIRRLRLTEACFRPCPGKATRSATRPIGFPEAQRRSLTKRSVSGGLRAAGWARQISLRDAAPLGASSACYILYPLGHKRGIVAAAANYRLVTLPQPVTDWNIVALIERGGSNS